MLNSNTYNHFTMCKQMSSLLFENKFFYRLFTYISTQEYCEQYWTSPGDSTLQSSSCTVTYHPSRKISKLDEPDMRDTAGEVGTNSLVTYSCGPLHIDEQRQNDLLEPTYNSSVLIRDVILGTCRKRWTIEKGGGRGSGISVQMARHDDDDDDDILVLHVECWCYH